MERFSRFLRGFQKDLKALLYWCLVLTLFRVAFIWWYQGQLPHGWDGEVARALWLGFRLSLKTAGLVMLAGVILATIPGTFVRRPVFNKVRLIWHGFALAVFSVLFFARIQYYKIFHAAFNNMIINGLHDDKAAILETALKEYHLPEGLLMSALLAAVLYRGLKLLLEHTGEFEVRDIYSPVVQWVVVAMTAVFLPVMWVFVRYGGSFNYAGSINWASAARLKTNLLNEAILDDLQALHRVRDNWKEVSKVVNIELSVQQIREMAETLGGDPRGKNLAEVLTRRAPGSPLSVKPMNVVVVLGESFGQWPLRQPFDRLKLTENVRQLERQGMSVNNLLPGGNGTIQALIGQVTGLYDCELYVNDREQALRRPFKAGIGYLFKELGYRTVFWYGGYSSWQNIENFTLAQGFDEFHCADEFGAEGTAWGVRDEVLAEHVANYIKEHENENRPTLHVVLTTNNHGPYSVPVDELGFDRAGVAAALPEDIANTEQNLTELGHIWHTDRVIGQLVRDVEKLDKTALFVITGDHSERFNFARPESDKVKSIVPCIFYGAGVEKVRKTIATGSAIQIPATLVELIAPAGHRYCSLLPGLLSQPDGAFAFNHRLYAVGDQVGPQTDEEMVKLAPDSKKIIEAANKLSAYWVIKGENF